MKSSFVIWIAILCLSTLSSCAYFEGRKYNQPQVPPKSTSSKGHTVEAPQGPGQPAGSTPSSTANETAGHLIAPLTH